MRMKIFIESSTKNEEYNFIKDLVLKKYNKKVDDDYEIVRVGGYTNLSAYFNLFKGYYKEYEGKVGVFNESLENHPLEVPDEKARIYSYISAFKRTDKKRSEFTRDHKWDFCNKEYWNLDTEYVRPLFDTLCNFIETSH